MQDVTVLLRWIGCAVLVVSLALGIIVVADVQIYQRLESFAFDPDTNEKMEDQIAAVPPWNSTGGWVGFNVTFPNEGKRGHEAGGLLLPGSEDYRPEVVLRVVNLTGLLILQIDQFDEAAWNDSKVYGVAYINASRTYSKFTLLGLDGAGKYTVLLRGLENRTESSPVLISIKESWLVNRSLIQPDSFSTLAIAATACFGGILIIWSYLKPKQSPSRRLRRKGPSRHLLTWEMCLL
jgi:hypothetical protein